MEPNFWNEKFSAEEYIYGVEPNVYFKQSINKIKPGKILVPAAGEGRDAVYAASIGWDVFAFDMSEVGKIKAMKLAESKNVKIQYDLYDVRHFEIKPDEYDAVVLSYFHLPENIRKEFYLKIISSLKKGGVIILEAFTPKQLNNTSGGPKEIQLLFSPEMLQKEFNGLNLVENKEHEIILDEGKLHKGKAIVVRFLAVKE
ncbi:MAG: class I SAM-dependent methyltransferase [Bacteroidia bacterium]|nr:class I SAM-dependent methyltransferase [Bacteroidia bacterium]